jgi:predicted DCC family thiol-disulfide oxidoreductase YuxK
MTLTELTQHQPVLFYDGVCNFCNSSVNFIIKKEKRPTLTFAALQSDAGDVVKATFGNNPVPDSLILFDNGKVYVKSSAALRITRYLRGGWPLFGIFWIIPPFIRHFVYDFIARNRYKWFGKKDQCMIPSPELRKRFLL